MAAKTFEEIMKFNPYHDARGRFATSGSFTSFTYSPGKSKAHDLAIQRQKERMAGIMPSEAQAKTLKGIESRTRNLKKEQFRVVDRDGNVIMEKQGDKHSVNFSVGEARDNFPGNITIHNHPDGGTFSSADLSAIGYGAVEIRAAAPEGTYILRNMRYKGKYDAAKEKTWYEMRDDIDAASEGFKPHRQIKSEVRKPFEEQTQPLAEKWVARKDAGAGQEELNKIAAEYTAKVESFRPQIEAAARKAYVDQYHHWYQSNAGNYGLEYEFIPVQTRTRKSDMEYDLIETIGKSDDDIVLDRKMHQDVEEITNAIIEEMKAEFPGVQKSAKERSVLFIGLKIANAEPLAIEGGENHEDFHITLAYGYFDQGGHDEDSVDVMVQGAIKDIRDLIPDKIHFDAIRRFEASESSDGKDVIYAQVAAGQLEEAHTSLLKALEKHGIKLESTFPEYKPHMTLAYIDPEAEYELKEIDNSGSITKVMIGHGRESTHENDYTIMKADEDKRVVFGWASISMTVDGVQLEDRQQDMIDPEDLEEAAYEYVLNFRDTGEEHIPTMRMKGKLVESCVFTEEKQRAMGIPPGTVPVGWWIGFKIFDDEAWEKVKNGTYRMFSIEGKANREPVEKSHEEEREEKLAKSFNEILGISPARTIEKNHPERFETIVEVFGKSEQFDHIDEVQKYNPYHDSRGRFASANGGAAVTYSGKPGRNYGTGDTKDAMEETDRATGKLKDNSLRAFMDADGNLDPKRAEIHKKIIDDILKGKVPVEGQAKMTMLGGGPASGKSSVMSTDTSKDKHSVTINPDDIKEMLPGYKEMAAKTSDAAGFYHEESSMIAKQLTSVIYNENYNALIDGTGDGSIGSVMKKVNGARAAGYSVEAKYVSVDTETAVMRNQKRYDDAVAKGQVPRLPKESVVRDTHAKCSDISVACAKEFDSIEIWDNNGGRGEQKLIATGGKGKNLKPVAGQESAFKNYLAKGTRGLDGFVTLPDGSVIPAE